jgi:CheY-like chemotaxis protein
MTVTGPPRPLAASVELCCYRIVQEALTNAGRHAPGRRVRVELGYQSAVLSVQVSNDGPVIAPRDPGECPEPGGYGLTGLRERVEMLHGEFRAGPGSPRRIRGGRGAAGRAGGRARVTGGEKLRLLVVDDQAVVRLGFTALLDSQDDMRVVGTAGDGHQAVRLSGQLKPDVVFMDIRMPVLGGIEATRLLTRAQARPKVLVLTTFDLDDYVYDALRAGPAASCSRTPRPRRSCTPCGSSAAARRCSRRPSAAGSSRSSPRDRGPCRGPNSAG